MQDIGFTTFTTLWTMSLFGQLIGPIHTFYIFFFKTTFYTGKEFILLLIDQSVKIKFHKTPRRFLSNSITVIHIFATPKNDTQHYHNSYTL